MKVFAVIVAGGFGKRFGANVPKQYTSSILGKTINKFLQANVDAIQVVIRNQDMDLYSEVTKNMNLLDPAIGGETRGESVKNGLRAVSKYNPDLVLVHDACRPYVSVKLINEIIHKLKEQHKGGVVPVVAVPETVKKLENKVENIDRNNLFLMQTPQGFYFHELLSIYENANEFYTDESTIAEANNIKIFYIPGEKNNIKITYKEDIMQDIRTGIGFDAHKFMPEIDSNNYIFLGGIKIAFDKKIEAHSDGDVLIHALVDAMLGATGEGDIGVHFPPTDPKWKNADSKLFLIHANNLLKKKNGYINNIDITVICERPRLGEYRVKIKTSLAEILGLNEGRINIKATTTEKMGFTGRGEGIAVQAVVTIVL